MQVIETNANIRKTATAKQNCKAELGEVARLTEGTLAHSSAENARLMQYCAARGLMSWVAYQPDSNAKIIEALCNLSKSNA